MSEQPIIKLENIDFYYEKGKPIEVHALQDVSLQINRGDFVSFFGPSGCGKSTMLYVISGIDQPEAGTVIVNGCNINKLSPKELAVFRQMGIGIIFQNFNLIPSISIIDNVMLPMAFLGIPLEIRKKKAMEILDHLNISQVAVRFPYELSGGQQQRVGIARALANDPPIILADEPTGNLDSVNAVKTMELLQEFNLKQNKTVILVTHESWSLKYVNKIFYMMDGKITKTEEKERSQVSGITKAEEAGEKGGPGLGKEEVQIRAISGVILKGHTAEEIKRFEVLLWRRLHGEITRDELFKELDKPFKEGGVGLWETKAKQVTDEVEEALEQKSELADLYARIGRHPEWKLNREVDDIRKWMTEEYAGKLSYYQAEKMDDVIRERIKNNIKKEDFVAVLNKPKRDGGLGLRITTSMRIAERFESLLDMNKPTEQAAVGQTGSAGEGK